MHTLLKTLLISVVGLALGLALASFGVTHAQQQGGEMAVDCEGNTRAIERDCQFGNGQQFTVAIHVAAAPSGGYPGVQAKLRWDNAVLNYRPTQNANGEAVWPQCTFPVRSNNAPNQPSVVFGCVTFTGQAAAQSNYTGPVWLVNFTCSGSGTSPLALVPRVGDNQNGSHLLDEIGNPIDPELGGASVACGGPQQQRPDPEFGTRSAGFGTPAPPGEDIPPPNGGGPGGQNGPDGTGNGTEDETSEAPDAMPTEGTAVVASPTVETTGTVVASGGDEDDGDGFPVWAWIVIGVAIVGGLGGAGFVAWRRYQASGGGDTGGAGP